VFGEKMFGTSFLNFSMRNVSIARIVCAELNVVRALQLRRGQHVYIQYAIAIRLTYTSDVSEHVRNVPAKRNVYTRRIRPTYTSDIHVSFDGSLLSVSFVGLFCRSLL